MASNTGIDTYIIKTVEWCNLNCTYCYFYNGQDTSFSGRPRHMSRNVLAAMVPKIIEHCQAHNIFEVQLVMHGGEPLLQSKDDYQYMMSEFDAIQRAGINVVWKCTTNAVTLTEEWAELLAERRIFLGVSIDGTKEVHDSMRVDHAGRGSYDRVVQGLKTAQRWESRGLSVGTISVINPSESGARTYQHLRSLGIRNINLVLPEANYVQPLPEDQPAGSHGETLKEIFDAWVQEDNNTVNIGFFRDVIRAVSGLPSYSDQFGSAPVNVAVIETDGSIQPTDNFRACADGMTDLGLNIFTHTFEDLLEHSFFAHCNQQQESIPSECSGCKFLEICGGGRVTHRYSEDDGFSRKSVHCESLYSLFEHVDQTLGFHGLRREVA